MAEVIPENLPVIERKFAECVEDAAKAREP